MKRFVIRMLPGAVLAAMIFLVPPDARSDADAFAVPAHPRGTADGLAVPAHPRGTADGLYQRRALARMLDEHISPVESLAVLVIRVSFSDRDFEDGTTDTTVHDSLYFADELRHLREYFLGASGGAFTIGLTMAPGIVELSRPEGYYGEDGLWDIRMTEILMEVVGAEDDRIDFRPYDSFAFIHAGAGQETDFNNDSSEQLWSGFIDPGEMEEALADTLGSPGVPTNDSVGGEPFYIDNLMIWPEDASQDGQTFGSLGVYAYQVGLRLGMTPLFDTTPSGYPDSQGIGSFGLMGYGLYNAAGFIPAFPCAFHRYLMGWFDVVEVTEDASIYITDINSSGAADTVMVRIPVGATEYFLVCNRVHDADFDGRFDFMDMDGDGIPESEDTLLGAEFDFFLTATTNPSVTEDLPGGGTILRTQTGSGLMIWHIDEGIIRRQLGIGRYPNDNPFLKGVDLEEADGMQDLDRPGGQYAFGSHYDSFREGGAIRFGGGTEPGSKANSGTASGIEISGISEAAHRMYCTVGFTLPVEIGTLTLAGRAGGSAPIIADVDGDGSEEIIVAADTGFVFIVAGADGEPWQVDVDTIASITSSAWTGPPVLADATGDNELEIYMTSEDVFLHAFTPHGTVVDIDTDGTPGSMRLLGSTVSLPMLVEADGDEEPEVLVLSSSDDYVNAYFLFADENLLGGGRCAGANTLKLPLALGRLASHPVRGIVKMEGDAAADGFFFCAWRGEGGVLDFHFVPLRQVSGEPGAGMTPIRRSISGAPYPWHICSPAAGDIDGDGSDDLVVPYPGLGLCYFSPPGGFFKIDLKGGRLSAPALEDLDRDGVLETAVRDEFALYLFTGIGRSKTGWPVMLSEDILELQSKDMPPPPIIFDLDTDGEAEVLFRVRGDLHALRADGRYVDGWPLPGSMDDPGSPALAVGAGSALYIFTAGDYIPVTGGEDGAASGAVPGAVLIRHSFGYSVARGRGWPFFRHDAGGTGRQEPSIYAKPPGMNVEEQSFMIYPNPSTTGRFTVRAIIGAPAEVTVRIMTVEGEKVVERTSAHDWPAGSRVPYEEIIRTDELSSGVYLCILEARGSGWKWHGARKLSVVR